MIWRRSHLATFSYDTLSLVAFNNVQRLKIFRSSVKFKRFRFKGTKFKRRQIRKLKHKSYWALQYNILKYWTDDFRVSRQYSRFQYHHRFFVNNSMITHHTTWSARSNRLFVRPGQWVSSSLSRCLYLTAAKTNNLAHLCTQKHNHHSFGFYLTDTMVRTKATTPFNSYFDDQTFTTNVEEDLSAFDVFLPNYTFDLLVLLQCVEFYKILQLSWIIFILKLTFYAY